MADVFLSYAEEDRQAALQVAAALTDFGWTVWSDREILPGRAFRRAIAKELEVAKCVVVLWSKNSIESDWVCDEAEDGRERGCLVPALIEAVKPPHGFRQWQAANLLGWDGDSTHAGLQLLKKGIQVYAPLAATPLPFTERPTTPRPPRNDRAGTPVPAPSPEPPAGRNVFLCYRREDTIETVGRLHDTLAAHYGTERIFMDIDSVPLGVDFISHVQKQMSQCSAVIVMIGRSWMTATDRRGRPRLDNEDDLVRSEIRAALTMKVPVIPVLVQDAQMPQAHDLPQDILPLARRNAIALSASRWRTDVERLIEQLDRVMKPSDTT